jgi:site-specific DNA-cytosine methylase/intein/homing endonuclease
LEQNEKVKIIELFAGIGSQYKALKNINVPVEVVGISEWDINCLISYNHIHHTPTEITLTKEEIIQKLKDFTFSNNTKTKCELSKLPLKKLRLLYDAHINTKNLGSVVDLKGENIPSHNLLTYSFPCFTENTLVLTDVGYKKINDIKVGDVVLTHTNTYKKVLNTYDQGIKEIWEIVGSGIDKIETTENHKFLTRTKIIKSHKRRSFTEPKWKETNELTKNDYLGIAINNNSIIPKWDGIDFEWSDGRKDRHKNELSILMDNKDFWWVIGRYIGDGWVRSEGGIIICCEGNNDIELTEITEKLKSINFSYNIVKEKTIYKIHIPKKEIELFVTQFGKYAYGKKLTNTIIDLPIDLLEQFIIGYHSADGSTKLTKHKISSVSRELIYGVAQCVSKVYKLPYSIYKDEPNRKNHKIEGRVVNQKTNYTLVYNFSTASNRMSFYENGYVWFPVTKVLNTHRNETVYDIEVEIDHTFTANGCIAHNCQDLSIQGKKKGLYAGERSSLLWQVGRILTELKGLDKLPNYLLMENVPGIYSEQNKAGFDDWKKMLTDLGYTNYDFKLKSTYFDVPQSRDRVYMISTLLGHYDVPKEVNFTTKTLRDILDLNDERWLDFTGFLPEPIVFRTSRNNIKKFDLIGKYKFETLGRIYSIDGVSPTLTTGIAGKIYMDGKIRFLNGRECYKLMGFTDQDVDNVLKVFDEGTLVKQAGNSIVVNVLEGIFTNLFKNNGN